MSRTLYIACLALLVAAVSCEVKEEPITIQKLFETLNARVQNATAQVENILGVDIPSTQEEVKTALQDNLNGLKTNAEKIQKKLAEYNVTGSTVTSLLTQAQAQINSTVEDLAKRNPDLNNLLEQVKKGYNSLAEVSKTVGDVVTDQATAVSGDLKTIADQAKSELTKAASQLESRVQEVLKDTQKKSKTA